MKPLHYVLMGSDGELMVSTERLDAHRIVGMAESEDGAKSLVQTLCKVKERRKEETKRTGAGRRKPPTR